MNTTNVNGGIIWLKVVQHADHLLYSKLDSSGVISNIEPTPQENRLRPPFPLLHPSLLFLPSCHLPFQFVPLPFSLKVGSLNAARGYGRAFEFPQQGPG